MRLPESLEGDFSAWWHDPAVSLAEMARRLGRRVGVVHKMGVARWGPREFGRRRLTDAEVERGRRLVRERGSVAAAARALGRTRGALAKALKKGGRWGKHARALRMLRAGHRPGEVGAAVGASPELVRWWRKEAGLGDGTRQKRERLSALMRREHANRRVVRDVGEMVAALDAGWPLCSRAERRALEALGEGPATVAELSARQGRSGRSIGLNRTLVRCLGKAWVVRERVGGTFVWRLSEAVAERRKTMTRGPGG